MNLKINLNNYVKTDILQKSQSQIREKQTSREIIFQGLYEIKNEQQLLDLAANFGEVEQCYIPQYHFIELDKTIYGSACIRFRKLEDSINFYNFLFDQSDLFNKNTM